MVELVNTSPEYADIRSIFFSRVVADLVQAAGGRIAGVSYNIQGIWDEYLRSTSQGEFHIRRRVDLPSGAKILSFFYGAIDFTKVEIYNLTDDDISFI
jgi:hypothetical protein